jgi:hypothetical protein
MTLMTVILTSILISFAAGQISALVIARYAFRWGAASANGELPHKAKPTEQDYTGGIDEEEDIAVQS